MEQDTYTNMTDTEAKNLDVSISIALIHRNVFVKYLKDLNIADADIVNTITDSNDENDFYERLLRVSSYQLDVNVLRAAMGAEEYKMLVNFARERLGKEPLFDDSRIDSRTRDWLEASEDNP